MGGYRQSRVRSGWARTWVWLVALWAVCAAGAAVAQSASGNGRYAIGAEVTGSFFDPARSGEGFFIQHITSNGEAALLVSWFTYVDGQQRWLIGVGPASLDEARIPLDITVGGQFPPNFNPASVQLQRWGDLTLKFSSKDNLVATWTTSFPGFSNGTLTVQRLSQPVQAYESADARVSACHSGAWYDPAQSGHGMFVEVLGSGTSRELLAVWYVYENGQQRWIIGQGPISGDTATLAALTTRGTGFGSAFNAANVVREPWGTMSFKALDGNRARWTWASTQPGYGSGTLELTRLTALSGKECANVSSGEAARFLTQASFGPTDATVSEVQTKGYAQWIDDQRALAATLHRPLTEQRIAAQVLVDPQNAQAYRAFRVQRWWETALAAPDQLRQRVAFALSQILVISDVGALDRQPIELSEYYDILVRNAFGNYRDLLRQVTLSPMMGTFLTHLRNQKTDWTIDARGVLVPGVVSPDENYAREVMQLFSIGLIERNRDFTPVLGGDGQPLATYTQELVTNTAKVLTGFSYDCSNAPASFGSITLNHNCGGCTGNACRFSSTAFFSVIGRYAASGNVTALVHPDSYRPMVCYPRYTDTGRSATAANGYAPLPAPNNEKTLLAGIKVGSSPVPCHAGTPASDQGSCINYCDTQLSTLLDSLFLHPNLPPFVSRQLIQRLTTSNPTPGYIDRVAAVFENDGSGVRGNLGAVIKAVLLDPEARTVFPSSNFAKLREPLLRYTAIWRAFNVQQPATGYNFNNPERVVQQRPLGAQSVFNFWEPDYQAPGELADAGLFSPEFQLLDESTFITAADDLWRKIFAGYNTNNATTTPFSAPTNAAWLPPSAIDALPAGHDALVEALNQKLMYGQMSSTLRDKLVAVLNGPLAGTDLRRKALSLIHLIAVSPAFAVQH